LDSIEYRAIEDWLMLTPMYATAINYVPNVEAVFQKMRQGADPEAAVAADATVAQNLALGPEALSIEVGDQRSDRSEVKITGEYGRTVSASSGTITSFLLMLA